MTITLIKVRKETAEKLKALKEFERQSYDEVINKIISMKTEYLSGEDIANIEMGLKDIKEGKIYSSKEVAQRLGIKR